MFNTIIQIYQLQAKDWEYGEPVLKNNQYTIQSKYTLKPNSCACEQPRFHKHGTTPRTVQLTELNAYPCFLKIKIQRFKCVNCGKTHTSKLPERMVSPGRKHSVLLTKQIIQKMRAKISIKDGAKFLHVSHYGFYRLLHQMSDKDDFSSLPEVLCVDELKATTDCEGNMAFIALDGKSHKIVTLLDDRRIHKLEAHFMSYPRKVRLGVKILVMDMNASYQKLSERCFPNAVVVTDRFHVVQQMSRAFNMLRIQTMKNFDTDCKEYRHLKHFWKHLLKNYDDLSTKPFYSRRLRKWTNSRDLVEQLIGYDDTLYQAWQVYQMASTHFRNKDAGSFFELIESLESSHLPEAFTSKYQFLLKKRDSISLALELPYSNGPLEGMNNKIKMLKRVAFGFRTFRNFKKRIILMNYK